MGMALLMSRIVMPALFAVSTVAASCGHDQTPPRDARADAAATAAQRLQGRWLLQGFQPLAPLEFALQQLLNAQIGQLVLEVNGTNMSIRGPGVAVQRTYRIDEAYGDHLQMMVFAHPGLSEVFHEACLDVDGKAIHSAKRKRKK